MNSDDFEKRLQKQPLRQIPSEWRQQILASATSSHPATLGSRPSLLSTINSQLSALLWPNPKAWIGLAAVWILIFAIQFESRNGPRVVFVTSTAAGTKMLAALKDRQVIIVNLMENSEPRDVDKPRNVPNQPHSELRNPLSMT